MAARGNSMVSEAATASRPSLWSTRNGVLLAAALISSAVAWWMIAWAQLTFANAAEHSGHFALTYAHVLGGTGMLLFRGLNLHLAACKDRLPMHRLVGKIYLACGVLGSVSAMVITSSSAHKAASAPVFTNASLSLLTLAVTWLAFSALGWRAVRNRRFARTRDDPLLRSCMVFRLLPHRISPVGHRQDRQRGGVHLVVLGRSAAAMRDGTAMA
jgi:hypothetical protein